MRACGRPRSLSARVLATAQTLSLGRVCSDGIVPAQPRRAAAAGKLPASCETSLQPVTGADAGPTTADPSRDDEGCALAHDADPGLALPLLALAWGLRRRRARAVR
jgi:MYXO-CTERM domain-containing protein